MNSVLVALLTSKKPGKTRKKPGKNPEKNPKVNILQLSEIIFGLYRYFLGFSVNLPNNIHL